MGSHYAILCVDRNVSGPDLRSAYHRQARKWHPDKHAGGEEHATEVFKSISLAYQVLSDPDTRARYDESLAIAAARHSTEQEPSWRSAPADPGLSDLDMGLLGVLIDVLDDVFEVASEVFLGLVDWL
ncbi:uncharacterized protein LOC100902146 [Galendromus occidentalis]|uniref:Uncharacterized protein LOC100902146 n=1 Tax=Galendromus occidentalis TaxID=34638 RepID=A0AAJ6W0N6_9ACAR|nr:uncharacterized protein LOC100902146 [Galendromus occidentalis]